MIAWNHKVRIPDFVSLFSPLFSSRLCVHACEDTHHYFACVAVRAPSVTGWHMVEGPEVGYTLENGQGQSRIPKPSSSSSFLTLRCHKMSPAGDGFPGNWLLLCSPRVTRGGSLKAWQGRGLAQKWYWVEQPNEPHEQGKQLYATAHYVSRSSFDTPLPNTSLSLINTRPWLKQQREPNEALFAYTCCVKSELMPECEFTLTWLC